MSKIVRSVPLTKAKIIRDMEVQHVDGLKHVEVKQVRGVKSKTGHWTARQRGAYSYCSTCFVDNV